MPEHSMEPLVEARQKALCSALGRHAARRSILLLGTIAVISSAPAHGAEPPWASLNGFYPGMSKAEAKSAGYGACNYGTGLSKDTVYCSLPPERAALGKLKVTAAKLEFKPPKLDVVSEISLQIVGSTLDAEYALRAKFGKPDYMNKYGTYWRRDGMPYEVRVSNPLDSDDPVFITFKYVPQMVQAPKRTTTEDKRRAATLKTF